MPRSHIVEIDHLRGLAILLTGVAHINAALVTPVPALSWLYSRAEFWGGVYLFFVISGYVITRGFAQSLEARGTAFWEAWLAFYRRRFFRIVPAALCWIGLTLLLAAAFNRHGSFGGMRSNLMQAWAAAVFAYNFVFPMWTVTFGVFWSLALEEQFYLVFPLLNRIPLRLRIALLIAPICLLFFVHRPAGSLAVFLPVDALCWGVLIALAERNGLTRRIEPTFLGNLRARTVVFLAALLALVLIPAWLKQFTPATSLMTLVCAWIVFCASFDRGYVLPAFSDWLRPLGLVSFSAYLCHIPAFLVAREIAITLGTVGIGSILQNVVAVAVALLLAAAFSAMSYVWVETPMRRKGAHQSRSYGIPARLPEH